MSLWDYWWLAARLGVSDVAASFGITAFLIGTGIVNLVVGGLLHYKWRGWPSAKEEFGTLAMWSFAPTTLVVLAFCLWQIFLAAPHSLYLSRAAEVESVKSQVDALEEKLKISEAETTSLRDALLVANTTASNLNHTIQILREVTEANRPAIEPLSWSFSHDNVLRRAKLQPNEQLTEVIVIPNKEALGSSQFVIVADKPILRAETSLVKKLPYHHSKSIVLSTNKLAVRVSIVDPPLTPMNPLRVLLFSKEEITTVTVRSQ